VIVDAVLVVGISLALVGIVSVMAFLSVYHQSDKLPPWSDEW